MNEGAFTTSSSSSRSLLYVALGVVALAVVTIVVVLLAGNREAAEFPTDSPEAALQAYLAGF
ncbi:MAG: hypothetical protein QOI85_1476, partial [Chloroflexota bacterium]|nr:hypothetical protein [Chloroflexota bacterium]